MRKSRRRIVDIIYYGDKYAHTMHSIDNFGKDFLFKMRNVRTFVLALLPGNRPENTPNLFSTEP